MLFELHCHTNRSDGKNSPAEMIARAQKMGLSGMALTDHNILTKVRPPKDFILIPGEEVTTLGGHMTCLGISEPIKPFLSVEESIDKVREQGGVSVFVHPFSKKVKSVFKFWDYKADAVEVCNPLGSSYETRKVIEVSRKKGVNQVVGSDAHYIEMVGKVLNVIEADSVDGVLKAIKKGKTRYFVNQASLHEKGVHVKRTFVADHVSESLLIRLANPFLHKLPVPVLSELYRTYDFYNDVSVFFQLKLLGL